MKKILAVLLFGLLISSCNKENEEVIIIDYLNNSWRVVEQSIDNISFDPYIKVVKWKNMDNNEITRIDTIFFGQSIYVFDTGFIDFCSLSTENFGSFSGFWEYDFALNKLTIVPSVINDTTWNRDTIINGNRYDGFGFIPDSFEIRKLTETNLELTFGDIYIKLEAN